MEAASVAAAMVVGAVVYGMLALGVGLVSFAPPGEMGAPAPIPVDVLPPLPEGPEKAPLSSGFADGEWFELGISTDAGADGGGLEFTERTDGGLIHHDPKGRFTASIDPDGTVEFTEPFPVEAKAFCLAGICRDANGWSFMGFGGGRMLQTTTIDPGNPDRGRTTNDNPEVPGVAMVIGVGGRFDRPRLSARIKTQFLERTEPMRTTMTEQWLGRNLEGAQSDLKRRLMRAWFTSGSASQRRAKLFQIWDDLADTPPSLAQTVGFGTGSSAQRVHRMRTDASAQARATVEAFIRTHLPAGSPTAFTPTELGALNSHRESGTRFAPYALPLQARE